MSEEGTIRTEHSAAGQAAGYEQQRQLALVLLAEAYGRQPDVRIRLEALEDIEVISTAQHVGVQVKHSIADGSLTDKTPELWTTLTVWMDLQKEMGDASLPLLHLATTATADPESGAALLRVDNRDEVTALSRLLKGAAESKAKATEAARSRFQELGEDRQRQLLSNVRVLDATARVTDLDDRLRVALGIGVPLGRETEFLQRLKGWWVGQSALLLAGDAPAVSGRELHLFVDTLRDEYRQPTLPVHEELRTDPGDEEAEALLDRPFIRQLRMVMATSQLLDLAVRHYYRAFAQRARWVREGHLVGHELDDYERQLQDEWEVAHAALRARASSDPGERCREGLDFALVLPDRTAARLRAEFHEPIVCRGTLHGMADDVRIGWHPDFQDRLEELLT